MGVLLEAKNDVPEETRDAVLAKESLQDSQKQQQQKIEEKADKNGDCCFKVSESVHASRDSCCVCVYTMECPSPIFLQRRCCGKVEVFQSNKRIISHIDTRK